MNADILLIFSSSNLAMDELARDRILGSSSDIMDAVPTTLRMIELVRERTETPSKLARSLSTRLGAGQTSHYQNLEGRGVERMFDDRVMTSEGLMRRSRDQLYLPSLLAHRLAHHRQHH